MAAATHDTTPRDIELLLTDLARLLGRAMARRRLREQRHAGPHIESPASGSSGSSGSSLESSNQENDAASPGEKTPLE